MLLLATDTSGKDGFVGLVRPNVEGMSARFEVIGEVPLAGGTFSAQLVPQISDLLGKHGFRKTDIDAFVVVSGPGSFTGLRVGLAAIKALAEILQKPIVPVSLLEILAAHSHMVVEGDEPRHATARPYAVALDAGRGEAFVGRYEIAAEPQDDGSYKPGDESLLNLDSLLELLVSGAAHWITTPDQAIFDAMSNKLPESKRRFIRRSLRRPRSLEVVTLGWKKLEVGETVSPEELEANYIRRSDAEIFAKPVRGF